MAEYEAMTPISIAVKRLRLFIWGLGLMMSCHPGKAILVGSLAMISGLIPAMSLYASKLIVDALAHLLSEGYDVSHTELGVALLLQLSILTGGSILSVVSSWTSTAMGKEYAMFVQMRLLNKIDNIDPIRFEESSFYDMMARAFGESSYSPFTLMKSCKPYAKWYVDHKKAVPKPAIQRSDSFMSFMEGTLPVDP